MIQRDLGVTREMRLMSKVIEHSGDCQDRSLPQFLAFRRQPGPEWMTWDQITIALHGVTGEVVTDASLRKWAQRYGIPEDSTQTGGPYSTDEFRAAVKAAGIKI